MTEETKIQYKVLTLYQPWATLLAHGLKRNETRPGETRWKGVYLIHAAKHLDKSQIDLFYESPFKEAMIGIYNTQRLNSILSQMPFGMIIGAFEVDRCIKILNTEEGSWETGSKWKVRIDPIFNFNLTSTEYLFGNYNAGRYIWVGKNHRILQNPIPYTGGQGYYQNFKGDVNQLIFK